MSTVWCVRLEMLGDAAHDVELQLVRAIHADFRRRDHLWEARKLRRKRLAGFRDDLDQAAGGIKRVVVAVIAIGEKHVPGHFAGQLGVLLLHLGFDERVAGLIHDRVAAQLIDSSYITCEHFTSPMKVAPGLRCRISRA